MIELTISLRGTELAVRHCAGEGELSVLVRARRDRLAAQWAKGTGEAIEKVRHGDGGACLAGPEVMIVCPLQLMSGVGGTASQCSMAVVKSGAIDPKPTSHRVSGGSAAVYIDALPEWFSCLPIDIRFGDRKLP